MEIEHKRNSSIRSRDSFSQPNTSKNDQIRHSKFSDALDTLAKDYKTRWTEIITGLIATDNLYEEDTRIPSNMVLHSSTPSNMGSSRQISNSGML